MSSIEEIKHRNRKHPANRQNRRIRHHHVFLKFANIDDLFPSQLDMISDDNKISAFKLGVFYSLHKNRRWTLGTHALDFYLHDSVRYPSIVSIKGYDAIYSDFRPAIITKRFNRPVNVVVGQSKVVTDLPDIKIKYIKATVNLAERPKPAKKLLAFKKKGNPGKCVDDYDYDYNEKLDMRDLPNDPTVPIKTLRNFKLLDYIQ